MRDAIKLEIEQDKASRLPAEKENRCVSALAERLQLDEMDADSPSLRSSARTSCPTSLPAA